VLSSLFKNETSLPVAKERKEFHLWNVNIFLIDSITNRF
jgi:hypothetical protein